MLTRFPRFVGLCLLLIFIAATAQADVRLPAILSSGMVLQREQPVPIWGWADPGEEVTVQFRDQTQKTTAASDGKWSVTLTPLSLGEAATLTVNGKNKLALDNILVGDVWLCSGQSNMSWTVRASLNPDLEIRCADWPEVRLFQVPTAVAMEPQQDVKATWKVCSPESIGNFSAVAYFFGRQLHQALDVPIGLVQSSVGGTPSEAWTSPAKVASVPEFGPLTQRWAGMVAKYDPEKAQQAFDAAMEKWKVDAEEAKKAEKAPPAQPVLAQNPQQHTHHPCGLYNAMIAPLQPFALKGAIWYQGESNAGRATEYRTIMPALIESWREAWNQGDFPFYQVQLANFRAIAQEPADSDWAELREAQVLATKKLPNVGAVCIIDLGTAFDIHPKDKQNVGARLARNVLHDVYQQKEIVPHGPTFENVNIEGNTALITFDVHGGGKLISYYQEPLRGFAVAGEDRKWHWANAKIVGNNQIAVTCDAVPQPVAVRYNWADNPQGNLYSEAYLPATQFRTDDWIREAK